jgi:uncharacterized protein YxeA
MKKISTSVGIIIIIAIVVIIFGGSFAWQYFSVHKTNNNIQKNSVSVDMNYWKTYTNDKYGFEVKYPVNFSISNNNGDDLGININPIGGDWRASTMFTVKPLNVNSSVKDWINNVISENQSNSGSLKQNTKTSYINGHRVWQFIINDGYKDDILHYALFEKTSSIFVEIIYKETAESEDSDSVNYDLILSTFKFTK